MYRMKKRKNLPGWDKLEEVGELTNVESEKHILKRLIAYWILAFSLELSFGGSKFPARDACIIFEIISRWKFGIFIQKAGKRCH